MQLLLALPNENVVAVASGQEGKKKQKEEDINKERERFASVLAPPSPVQRTPPALIRV